MSNTFITHSTAQLDSGIAPATSSDFDEIASKFDFSKDVAALSAQMSKFDLIKHLFLFSVVTGIFLILGAFQIYQRNETQVNGVNPQKNQHAHIETVDEILPELNILHMLKN